jgi:hypothetical protein
MAIFWSPPATKEGALPTITPLGGDATQHERGFVSFSHEDESPFFSSSWFLLSSRPQKLKGLRKEHKGGSSYVDSTTKFTIEFEWSRKMKVSIEIEYKVKTVLPLSFHSFFYLALYCNAKWLFLSFFFREKRRKLGVLRPIRRTGAAQPKNRRLQISTSPPNFAHLTTPTPVDSRQATNR